MPVDFPCVRQSLIARILLAGLAASLFPLIAAAQPHGELIGWNSVRYYVSAEAAERPRTSPFFWREPERIGDAPEVFALQPEWMHRDGETTITISIPVGTSLYGLGRAPGTLERHSGRYEGPQISPWILGVRQDGSAFGLLLDTTWAFAVEIQREDGDIGEVRFETPDPDPSLIIFDLADPPEVIVALGGITGRMEIPPLWALGIQRDIAPHAEPTEILPWIETAWLPCEIITQSGEPTCFDAPAADALSDAGQLRIAAGDPGVPREIVRDIEQTMEPAQSPLAWIRSESGELVEVRGRHIPDLTSPPMREWWSSQIGELARRDARGLVLMQPPLGGIPRNAQLAGDPELSGPGTVAQYEGVFGLLAARTAWEALLPEERDHRVAVVVPTAALGAHRWSMHLIPAATPEATTPQQLIAGALNSSLTSQALVGATLPSPTSMDADAWSRWLGAAAMLPILHLQEVHRVQPDGESETADLLRAAALHRRQILPYLYTLAFHTFFQGDLIMRSLFLLDPTDPELRNVDTAFMLGNDLLVVPPLGEETFKHEARFSSWRRLSLGEENPHLPALYMRPGSIIPLAPEGSSTFERTLDPLTIVVWRDEQGEARGLLYEDELDNFGLFRGATRRLSYHVTTRDDTVFVRLNSMDGGWGMPRRQLMVRLLLPEGEIVAEGTERGTMRIPLNAAAADR